MRAAAHDAVGGFSLVEMLLAIAILGLGLILIAAAYPIAVHWTAQNAHSTIAEVIAQDAAGIITAQYGPGSTYAPPGATYWTPVVPATTPPSYMLLVPSGGSAGPPYYAQLYSQGANGPTATWASGNAYAVGQEVVVASGDPGYVCTQANTASLSNEPGTAGGSAYWSTTPYYWTAYARPDPAGAASSSNSGTPYDVYILVFNEGALSNPPPTLLVNTWNGLTNPPPTANPMPIGSSGVDLTTGQVFRLVVDPVGKFTMSGLPSGTYPNNDEILYSPPATGQTASPLVYVFVFTVNL